MRRIAEFDALRGVAAVVVVVFHLLEDPRLGLMGSAVDLFFVLSGFLITSIILRTHEAPGFLRGFYLRRALRIWPIYYLSFLVLWAYVPFFQHDPSFEGLPYYLSFTQNIQQNWKGRVAPHFPLYGHTWTLAIEEQFYLLWPILVPIVGRKRLPLLLVPLIVGPIFARVAGVPISAIVARCDALAWGGLLAWLASGPGADRLRSTRARWAFGLIGAAGVVGVVGFGRLTGLHYLQWPYEGPAMPRVWASLQMSSLGLAYLSAVGFTISSAGRPWMRPLRGPVLGYLGRISYGLYLFHPLAFFPVNQLRYRAFGGHDWFVFDLAKLALAVGMAAASYRFIEAPILRYKDRISSGSGSGAAIASAVPSTTGEADSIRADPGVRLPVPGATHLGTSARESRPEARPGEAGRSGAGGGVA
ncbi:acyltransferase family protein [Tautonia plasticadhaerens]|uniref:O-acetyltransferase OatA n=1 Tax=Tautonia plasticadhaerens TaxID=2527974 RepID=A0A518HAL8_9BACT|nr:acyltransferase [Tautonia plasticadhaerens]QDV37898.1 O-acetyltransferase OatA [Tautonia plasticadhaerens]